MINEGWVEKTVHDYYDFLLNKFDFVEFLKEETQRNIYFYYKKKNFLVRVQYNYPNNFIEIDLYKEDDISKLIGAPNISLRHIWRDKIPTYNEDDYLAIMPSQIPIEESLAKLSDLLKQYASSYLNG